MKRFGVARGADSAQNFHKAAFLPVLIIPGFMSSGLQIQKSNLKESWEGKRVWLNLVSLGFESLHFFSSGPTKARDKDENDDEGKPLRSMWVHHMSLSDMKNERSGIQVRAIPGLRGVDYLTPGSLTNHLSYVFGPVIRELERVGYVDGVNLDAASYDWRLAPADLQERDQYFTNVIEKVEMLYDNAGKIPVVLLCHSLGTKTGHYFLNFAKKHRGQEWIDTFIHTYMPVGAPHLGAPKALRSTVSGDKMSLDAFLSDSEALIFGRSLGSGPWMMPRELPPDAPSNVFLRNDGILEVIIQPNIETDVLLNKRDDYHKPDKLKLAVMYDGCALSTKFTPIDLEDQTVSFHEKFRFRTPGSGPTRGLAVLLCEPGFGPRKKSWTKSRENRKLWEKRFFRKWKCDCDCWTDMETCLKSRPLTKCLSSITCFCVVWPIARYTFEVACKLTVCILYSSYWFLFEGTSLTVDEISKASGRSSALCGGKIPISMLRSAISNSNKTAEFECDLFRIRDKRKCCLREKRKTAVTVTVRWVSPNQTEGRDQCKWTPVSKVWGEGRNVKLSSTKQGPVKKEYEYRVQNGSDLLARGCLDRPLQLVRSTYDSDPMDPRGLSSSGAPPVKRVRAIYGVNLPTEVGAVYRCNRGDIQSEDQVTSLYTLDTDATLVSDEDGYKLESGILKETEETPQLVGESGEHNKKYVKISGDGTVPYWSLQHVRSWASKCDVTVDELDKAEHREILADQRFHSILVDYVCLSESDQGVLDDNNASKISE